MLILEVDCACCVAHCTGILQPVCCKRWFCTCGVCICAYVRLSVNCVSALMYMCEVCTCVLVCLQQRLQVEREGCHPEVELQSVGGVDPHGRKVPPSIRRHAHVVESSPEIIPV